MSRKYVKIDGYSKQILEMKVQGKTSRETAQTLGVEQRCIRNWMTRHKPVSFEEANKMIDDYIYFYNHERIQAKTGLARLALCQSC